MKKQLIFFLFILCCFSCASQKKEIIAKSTIKLEGKNTNIRDLLDIDGIYASALIFFEDGSLANPLLKEQLKDNKIENMSTSVCLRKKGGQTFWGDFWGVYTIRHDTIIAHVYEKATWYSSWKLSEKRYKILNRTTIQLFYSNDLLHTESDKAYLATQKISPWVDIDKNTLYFTPTDSILSSNNWLKENKWIWRNESDWKVYMDRIKLEKKKKK